MKSHELYHGLVVVHENRHKMVTKTVRTLFGRSKYPQVVILELLDLETKSQEEINVPPLQEWEVIEDPHEYLLLPIQVRPSSSG